jgi:hypothetical protein
MLARCAKNMVFQIAIAKFRIKKMLIILSWHKMKMYMSRVLLLFFGLASGMDETGHHMQRCINSVMPLKHHSDSPVLSDSFIWKSNFRSSNPNKRGLFRLVAHANVAAGLGTALLGSVNILSGNEYVGIGICCVSASNFAAAGLFWMRYKQSQRNIGNFRDLDWFKLQ